MVVSILPFCVAQTIMIFLWFYVLYATLLRILDIIFVFLDKVDKLSFILLGGTVDPRFKHTHSKKEVYKTNMET